MYTRKDALQAAKQIRTCPPIEIWSDPAHGKNIDAHLRICPYCSPELKSELSFWKELADSLRSEIPEIRPPKPVSDPTPGQFRIIDRPRGFWKNGFYYSAPVVLVLETTESGERIRVAQVYHDPLLAGPGDILLDQAEVPFEEPFIETWNLFTVDRRKLGPVLGACGLRVVEAALDMGTRAAEPPDWVPLLSPITLYDPRRYFRDLEKEVSSLFSDMFENETDSGTGRVIDLSIRADLKKLEPGVRWKVPPKTTDQIFALAGFPDAWYEHAAADKSEEPIWVNRIVIRKGRVESLTPVRGKIIIREHHGRERTYFGRFSGLESCTGQSRLIALLCTEDGTCVSPQNLKWEPDQLRFFIRFQWDRSDDADLKLALICEEAA